MRARGVPITDKLIRHAARLLLQSAGTNRDVALGVKCMRDMMLATTKLKRKYAIREEVLNG